jgi:hypothetical protein
MAAAVSDDGACVSEECVRCVFFISIFHLAIFFVGAIVMPFLVTIFCVCVHPTRCFLGVVTCARAFPAMLRTETLLFLC